MVLTWTAPGDDSLTGRAARYDLRYSTQPMTAATFSRASSAPNLPLPGPPGSTQSARIDGLVSSNLYYFAIKSVDDHGNVSVMSNVVVRWPVEAAGADAALELAFSEPRPNPARERASFHLELPTPMWVRVEVFDVAGRRVRTLLDAPHGAGLEDLAFDLHDDHGARLAQGVYLVRARVGETAFLRRLVITR